MTLQHLEEKVAAVEERALHLSLIGFGRFEADELAETWQTVDTLGVQLEQHRCAMGQRLSDRVDGMKAELQVIEMRLANQGKDSLHPVAA